VQVTPQKKQLILVGGGHANVQVILSFAMQPLRDVSVLLISDQILAGYSGMLPGWIAGQFSREQTHIDLSRLCSVCGVTFIHSPVTNIDTDAQLVICQNRPAFYYDLLCINTGSKPAALATTSEQAVIPIKPVEEFLLRLDGCLNQNDNKILLSIIGGGVAGVEVMFSLCERYAKHSNIQYQLITSNTHIVPQLNNSARNYLRQELKSRNVSTKTQFTLEKVVDGKLIAVLCDQLPSVGVSHQHGLKTLTCKKTRLGLYRLMIHFRVLPAQMYLRLEILPLFKVRILKNQACMRSDKVSF